jgi:hypothetical protein
MPSGMLVTGLPALLEADLRRLATRLDACGYPVAEVGGAAGACALLVDRGGAQRAAILPTALAALEGFDLAAATRALCALAPSRKLTLLAWGSAPEPSARARLRTAGVELALYEPVDVAVLRFQLNRALAPGDAPRRARRAPLDREVALLRWRRSRRARVYTLSSQGAFILTEEPLRPGRRLTLEVPIGMLRPRARARVVLSNPPGARARADLPPGMAVAFHPLDAPSAAVIERLVVERLAGLAV